MGQRLIAVAVVVASACTALHYSTTSQRAVVVSNNPYHYSQPGSAFFVVSAQGSGDDDIIDSIVFDNCSSQWTLIFNDPQGPPPGPQVCGGLSMPSGQLFTDFAACPRTYQFGVGYAGTVPGLSSCDVLIYTSKNGGSGSASGIATLMLSGSGAGPTGISVMPSMINFGDVQMGSQSSPSQVTVKNNSTTAIVTVNGTLTGAGVYAATPNTYNSFGLGPGSSQVFDVTCTPPAINSYPGSFSFTSGSSSGATTLTCAGINSTVTITPTQVNFQSTLVGRPPPMRSVMIGGNPAAVLDSITLDAMALASGVSISGTNPQGMPIGTGQSVVLAYSAAAMHAQGPLGNLAIKVSTDAAPRNVAIAGEALLGGVGTNPASVEFGAVCAGGNVMRDVEVYADEPGDVMLMSLTKPAAPFDAIAVDPLPRMLGGNHSGASVTVRAELDATTAGDFADAFALNSNVPNTPTSEVQLHATVLAGGIAATPDIVHFGTVMPPMTSSPKMVQLTNCGTGPLMFTGASITGVNAAEFTLIGSNPARTIPPTESEIFMVIMQPDNGGYKTARLVIGHDAGGTNVDLDGTGDGDGNNKERETYYACSTGHTTAWWPIALALLALRRRRR